MTDLECRALLGDKQAQEECTRLGIALPCPCCGEKVEAIMHGECVYHIRNSCLLDYKFTSLSVWNTRPAPPIRRCGECKHAYINAFAASSGMVLCRLRTNKAEGVQVPMQQDDFCSYFEPNGVNSNEESKV